MGNYSFKYEDNKGKITYEFEDNITIEEMLEKFNEFLVAIGHFPIDIDGALGYDDEGGEEVCNIPPDEPIIPDNSSAIPSNMWKSVEKIDTRFN